MHFEDLGLSQDVLRAVGDAGYVEPTPIQRQAIPVVLQGRDLLGIAQTGTGKTAAFTLPILDILAGGPAKARMPRSLILTPTRELATQIAENFETYGKYSRLTMALLIGGVSISEQEKKLSRGVDVLIATPGRLIDLFERGRILFAGVKILVIDEADRMLDMGFIPDVERIAALLPPLRQTLLFSATMPAAVQRLAARFMLNPKEVRVDPPASPAEMVEHVIAPVAAADKGAALKALLGGESVRNALIFCNRKRDVDALARALKRASLAAAALHGDMPQPARVEVLEAFKGGEVRFLVATDVAARGLDVFGLSHVFNYDVPTHPEDYIHRIGRTGRAGHRGRAIMLATPADERFVTAIEALIGRPVPRIDLGLTPGHHRPAEAAPAPRGRRRTTEAEPAPRARRRRAAPAEKPAEKPAEEVAVAAAPAAPREPAAPSETTALSEPAAPSETAETPRRRRPAAKPKAAEPAPRSRHKAPADEPVVGMGDHVPAFLLRPVVPR